MSELSLVDIAKLNTDNSPTLNKFTTITDPNSGETFKITFYALMQIMNVLSGGGGLGNYIQGTTVIPSILSSGAFYFVPAGTYPEFGNFNTTGSTPTNTVPANQLWMVSYDGTKWNGVQFPVDLVNYLNVNQIDATGGVVSTSRLDALLSGATNKLTSTAWANYTASANVANWTITNNANNSTIVRSGTAASSGNRAYLAMSLTVDRKYRLTFTATSTSTTIIRIQYGVDYAGSTFTLLLNIPVSSTNYAGTVDFTATADMKYLLLSGNDFTASASLSIAGIYVSDITDGVTLVNSGNVDADSGLSVVSTSKLTNLLTSGANIQTDLTFKQGGANATSITITNTVNSDGTTTSVMSRATAASSAARPYINVTGLIVGNKIRISGSYIWAGGSDIGGQDLFFASALTGSSVFNYILTNFAAGSADFSVEMVATADMIYLSSNGSKFTANSSLTIENLTIVDVTAEGSKIVTFNALDDYVPDQTATQLAISNLQKQVYGNSKEIFFPTKLSLFAGNSYRFYKSNIIRDWTQLNRTFLSLMIAGNTSGKQSKVLSAPDEILLNANDLTSGQAAGLSVVVKNMDEPSTYTKLECVPQIVTKTAKTGNTIKLLCNGDSLTYRGLPTFINRNNTWNTTGATLSFIGTLLDGYDSVKCEAITGSTYQNWIGMSSQRADGSVMSSSFLRLATATDKTNHPTWCFTSTGALSETNYTNATDKTQNFYIVDLAAYFATNGTPDYFLTEFGTNDINLFADAVPGMQLYFEIISSQLASAAPNCKWIVLNGMPKAAGYNRLTSEWNLINSVYANIASKSYSCYVVEPHIFVSKFYAHPISTTSIGVTGNSATIKTEGDQVHFDAQNYTQMTDNILAYIIGN